MDEPRALSVLVVSYRRADLLARCLTSVREHLPDRPVHIWDNHSDGSTAVRELADAHPDLRWTFSEHNVGYAAAVNALAERTSPDDMLLLNPDAELTGGVNRCRQALHQPRVAAVSPTVLDHTSGRQRWDIAHRRQTVLRALVSHAGYAEQLRATPFSDLYPGLPSEVDGYLTGCCLLVSRSAWNELGGFDERFFVYGEETDWQRRARTRGWRLLLVDEPEVRHSGHGTTTGNEVLARRGVDLLRAGQATVLGLHGNRGPGAAFTAGLMVLDRVQRSHRAVRRHARSTAADRATPGRPSILLTTNQLCLGGAERQRVLLANELAARGWPVTIACLQAFGPLAGELDPTVRLVLTPWWQPVVDLPTDDAVLVTGITNTEAGFATGWRAAGTFARGIRRRWLAATHEPAERGGPTYGRLLGRVVASSDGVIALSPRHWQQITRNQPLHTRHHIAPNGVPAQADRGFAPRSPLRLGVLSRIVEHKNPHLLIDALAALSQMDWTLDVFGDGPDRQRLEARTPPTVADRVRWRGWSPGPDHAFADVDVLCVPSRAEAFPMAIVEAMIRGVPVVASAVGSVPDILDDGRAGVLVEPVTRQAWTEALRPLLADPARLSSLARAGWERARAHYTVAAMADAYEAALSTVTAG